MSDIVKRLRNNEKLLPHMAAMLREEPLTSGLAGMVDAYVAESKEAAAEIERLRAALEEIAEGGVFSFGLSFDPDGSDPVALQGEQRFVLLRDVKAIADRARAVVKGDA